MKKISYIACHYGAEFLAWAIRSVQDAVDEIHVLYSEKPTHQRVSGLVCPETEADLRREAERFLRKPLYWHRGNDWHSEGEHRDAIFPIAREHGAEIVLWVDADEIWDPATALAAVEEAERHKERAMRTHFVHFWKSFNWMCRDGAWPHRVFNLRNPANLMEGYLSETKLPVFHFGYAIKRATMEYKWKIHGHLAELRKGWLQEKWLGWKPGVNDVHPTCKEGYWNPAPTPPEYLKILEPLLIDHPYWGREIIE